MKALEQLFLLGALTNDYKLSDPVGLQMARLPLDPMYSKALILADNFKCLEEMLIVVAMLSVESIFYFSHDKREEVCISTMYKCCEVFLLNAQCNLHCESCNFISYVNACS